ncbi:anthranilate phosphoribosyltransferase [Nitrosophilus kaiyonis]|uniref:anthranilate phosphoribosyltransferase n=1 Tax=Nitrosophilus kaiyonis TaxID=2930200 RepID=UPI00249112C4|nr:anthranilate phosphoribosyltransferase [Nitrosophilus kaiyonis]
MNFNEAYEKFTILFENKMSEDEAKNFLIELYEKGESAQEIAAAAKVMREYSIKLPVSKDLQEKLIDVVGTGGDKSGSFNISSTVAIILASLGSYVAKHGNRSITSKSGSADMLEALGINLNLSPENQVKMLEVCGFCFIFAQNFHPAMKYIMPIRKSLPHRTIFNILGPLTNPAGAKKYLLGVFDKNYIEKIAKALTLIDTKRAIVVSSRDGMDEISISDITYACEVKNKNIYEFIIDPREYNIPYSPFNAILGGDAKENAKITKNILTGELKGAKRDIVVLNAAAALVVDEKASSIEEGIDLANEAIDSKKAYNKLNEIIEISNKLSK